MITYTMVRKLSKKGKAGEGDLWGKLIEKKDLINSQ